MSHPAPSLPVLIVDDDDNLRATMDRLLRRLGHPVTVANGGTEAVEALRAGFRGLILLDIMMPDMDGWSAIRALQEARLLEGSLICMLTAMVEPDERAEGLGEFVFDYLVKPFDISQLKAVLQQAAEHLAPQP